MKSSKDALEFHSSGRKGKIEVISTKPCNTEQDLALAYSPGVALPCMEIVKDPLKVFEYTIRGNLVAVISNGTAVLGLGNIGPLASKPVMEGKGILFKKFADIDVFDIELDAKTVDEFVQVVKALEPTFGGINLEDIKAPECFEIEERLTSQMQIPIFHDDQHGTAIISAAALINASEITKRPMGSLRFVFNGAGAASIACARLFLDLGVLRENIIMCDSKGVIYKGRKEGMNKNKEEFAIEYNPKIQNLKEALVGAQVFMGLSVGGAMTADMLKGMAKDPIVFALANPTPEIMPDVAKAARKDVIIATGRSDFPNQVNNLLCFPFIFKGALDVKATALTKEMKLATVHALAQLAHEEIPESVSHAYDGKHFEFGPDYLLPKPFDPRVLLRIAPAVAKAAKDSGVARFPITNYDKYREKLESLQGASKEIVREIINDVKRNVRSKKHNLPSIIFPEANNSKVLKAVSQILEEGFAKPILIGDKEHILKTAEDLRLDEIKDLQVFKPETYVKYDKYIKELHKLRHRRGVHFREAQRLMRDTNYFAAMSVYLGDADAMITGTTQNYADSVRPVLQIIGRSDKSVAAGLIIMIINREIYFFADTTVNIDPSAEQLASIALHVADMAQFFRIQPRIAMVSFSNFAAFHPTPQKMRRAAEIVRETHPQLMIDGEMQVSTALNTDVIKELFPFCQLKKSANILIFPNLDSGNIAYKMVQRLGKGEILGPFLMGVKYPANVLHRSCSVNDIVNTAAFTALQVHTLKEKKLTL